MVRCVRVREPRVGMYPARTFDAYVRHLYKYMSIAIAVFVATTSLCDHSSFTVRL